MTTRPDRRARGLLLVAGAAVLLAVAAVGLFWLAWNRPVAVADGARTLVRIEPGLTLSAVADTLVARGLLRQRRVFLLGARLSGRDRDLQAGLYDLPDTVSPHRLLALLTRGATVQRSVTLPEGLDADEMAALVGHAFDLSPADFLAAADSVVRVAMDRQPGLISPQGRAILDSLVAGNAATPRPRPRRCEGYLAPDTYRFTEGVAAPTVAATLVATQLARLDAALALVRARAATDGRPVPTGHELLTLASIVEAEARLARERPLIAAVYANRLARGWRLEADPTVAYFLAKKGRRLYYKDLRRESLYNTYRHHGLPPGPIDNPGSAALLATALPDSACRALYFVSDGNGGHVFSETAREHEAAVERFRQARRRSP